MEQLLSDNNLMSLKFSVLMSVYKNDNPEYFKAAIESVINQTVKPTEIVLVRDGMVADNLQETINEIINETVWIRTDLNVNLSCQMKFNSIKNELNFNKINKITLIKEET